jgi:hypothetical protein
VQLRAYIALVHVDYRPVLKAIHREDAELLRLVEERDKAQALRLWSAKLEHWVKDFISHLDEDFDLARWLELHGSLAD